MNRNNAWLYWSTAFMIHSAAFCMGVMWLSENWGHPERPIVLTITVLCLVLTIFFAGTWPED